MKYGLNIIKLDYLHKNWGGLMVKELNSILEVQGSNFTNDMHCSQHWNIHQIFHSDLDYLS
jgi:hypothetical protein